MAPRALNAGAVAQEVVSPMHPDGIPDGPLVYFIQSVNGGPVKIGFVHRASALKTRVVDLQIASPYPLQVVKTVPGDRHVEWQMHERFERWRLSGEWFLPAKEIEAFCGRGLGRRGEAAGMQRLIDKTYQRGYDAGYTDGEWEGRKILAKSIYRVVGLPEEWDEEQPNGTQLVHTPLEEAS